MKRSLKLPILAAVVATLFLAGCSNNSGNITNSGAITPLGSTQYDWGDINIRGGDVKYTFELKNESPSEDLYLKGAQTSCTCTTARYQLPDGSISPKFGMHNNPTNWSAPIKPGETFKVEVVFNPIFHGPKATGPIQRTVDLLTSARSAGSVGPVAQKNKGGNTTLRVSGVVLSEADYKAKYNN